MPAETLPNAFARLDALAGWQRLAGPAPEGLVFDEGAVMLGEPGRRPLPDVEPSGSFGGRRLPRGVAVTALGQVFLADPEHARILVLSPGWGTLPRPDDAPPYWPFRRLFATPETAATEPADDPCALTGESGPPADPYTLVRPTDVSISPAGDLVIVDPGAGRILVLVLPSGAIRRVVTIDGEPTAIGFDTHGRAYVALRVARTVVRFDAGWRIDMDYRGGEGALRAPTAIAVIRGPVCRCRAGDPCACAVPDRADLPDGTAFVLDGGRIAALDPHGRPTDAALPGLLPDPPFTLSPEGALERPLPPREPLRLAGVTVDRRGRIDGVPLVARPRRVVRPRTATWLAGPFDGERDAFAWDRLLFDVDLPERTSLVVSTLTADAALEPERVLAQPDEAWSMPLAIEPDTAPELLVQSMPGRHLWLRIELFGDGVATPAIHAVEIAAPRRSSIRYLPVPFHQDPEGRHFLDRLLAYFDAVLWEPTAIARGFPAYLDAEAAPVGAFLDWLGGWFDWAFLAAWPEKTRREMIARAIPYFRARGTARGLRQLLQWHTGVADPFPVILEHFRLRERSPVPPLHIGGFPLAPPAAETAHVFTLVLPAAAVADRAQVEALIEAQKPAHTRCELRLIEPGFRIARQSSLSVDSLVGGVPMRPLGLGHLAQSTITALSGPPRIGSAILAHPGG